MPGVTLVLILQLPPLAFRPALRPAPFQPPRELTCPLAALGRPWQPPPLPAARVRRFPLDPGLMRPSEPEHLLNPVADIFLLYGLAGLASSTGGSVDFRSWSERNAWRLPVLPTQANQRF